MRILKVLPALTIGVLLTMIFGCACRGGKTNEGGNQPRLTSSKSLSGGSEMDDSYSITVTRDMNLPADRVWDAWNSPEK